MVKITTTAFIEKAKLKFGEKFDYSKVNYINAQTPVTIICPIHGEFEIKPVLFLQSKYGCRKCSIIEGHKKQTKSQEKFLEECKQIYGDRFDYSKVNYVNAETKVIIICPEHGEFKTRPADFIKGHNCPKCKGKVAIEFNKKIKSDNTKIFIKKAKEIHGDKYDYSYVNYINSRTKVSISCPKHGIFEQLPNHHLQGTGCPLCNSSHGENLVGNILNELNISYQSQYQISDNLGNLFIDFCIKINNKLMFIEFNGEQHYKLVKVFGNLNNFEYQIDRDSRLRDYCFDNDIPLLELKYSLSEQQIKEKILKLIRK